MIRQTEVVKTLKRTPGSNYYRMRRASVESNGFDRLFSFAPDGLVITDREGAILRANPASLWMLGYEDDRILTGTKNIRGLFYNDDEQGFFVSTLEMVTDEILPASRLEARLVRQDETIFPAEITVGMFDPIYRTAQIIIHDNTAHHQAEATSMQALIDLEMSYTATLDGWGRALEMRDQETEGHSRRVTEKAVEIALLMGFKVTELINIRHGALLHDIGKMAIPDSILLKKGTLTPEERKIMERHATYAYDLLSPIMYLDQALVIPYCHHEKWDGSGYPRGLIGEAIPLEARIFTVVDVWDALSSDRPYRPAWPAEKVREYLIDHAEKDFDPRVIEKFLLTI